MKVIEKIVKKDTKSKENSKKKYEKKVSNYEFVLEFMAIASILSDNN